jgi:3',5'-nucleoside bisphosphate phosphatase
VIDLHLHTTASDGSLSPAALVARAVSAGITTLSVTDHDTIAGLAEARAAASSHGVAFVNGIEITAVEDQRDIHVLGYFFSPGDAALTAFLERQRADRVRRVQEIAGRLAAMGCPVDVRVILEQGMYNGRSIGRPHIADALITGGHALTRDEAFERFIGAGAPAFVPRRGASAATVIAVIRAAGGVASLAHPGLTRRDDLIQPLAESGMAAIEVRHSEHDAETEARYRSLAATLGLAITGGSDFHAENTGRAPKLGVITLSESELDRLRERCTA